MALRSLDNALPIPSERPKKQAKVSIGTTKQPNLGPINDENVAPMAPPPANVEAIDYISSDDLKALPDPDAKIQVIDVVISFKDWMFNAFIMFLVVLDLNHLIVCVCVCNFVLGEMQSLMEGLESKDWIKVCDSLNDARRLAIYHDNLLFPIL